MTNNNSNLPINILLAEDDIDDRFFFEKAIKLISIEINIKMVNDGEQLMEYLIEKNQNLPDIIFLDISMPRKTGIECLIEIKENEFLNKIPIAMLSTSFTKGDTYEDSIRVMLLQMGAIEYIRKPSNIAGLKTVIENTIKLVSIKFLPAKKMK